MDHAKRFALLDIFLDTTKAMCMGEIIAQEVAAAGRPLALDEYVEIATDKTAVLFAACCRTAALLCDAPEAQQRCLGELGLHFGLAFQMADDLVDKDHGLDDERRPGGRSPAPTRRRRGTASQNSPRAPTVIPSAISWIT